MAFIGDTTAGQQFIATQDALEAPAQSESTAPTESSPFGKRIEAFRKALPGLERVAKRTEHRGKAATPWTDEELNAAKNRLHSLIFDGQERDKLPNADHERSVHFGYALAVHHAKLEGTPGQQAEWYPKAQKAVEAFLARQSQDDAPKKSGTTRMTDTGNKLTAVVS